MIKLMLLFISLHFVLKKTVPYNTQRAAAPVRIFQPINDVNLNELNPTVTWVIGHQFLVTLAVEFSSALG